MGLDLDHLREQNIARLVRWHGETEWNGADWSNAMCGEAGEAANIVKKLRRWETGLADPQAAAPDVQIQALAYEIADMIIYADILARHYEIDLSAAIVEKFNLTSARNDFPERLLLPGDAR